MGDGQDLAAGARDPGAAFAAARELIELAEAEAARIVADASRRARAREQEAELLVAKARRVLAAAEEKAAVILASAREAAAAGAVLVDLTERDRSTGPDLQAAGGAEPGPVRAESLPSTVDRLVASAVAQAVHKAFPADAAS